MKKAIIAVIAALVLIPVSYALGFHAGLNSPPNPDKGAYNITIHEDTGVVDITTELQYVHQGAREDKLVIYGKPTFEEVK